MHVTEQETFWRGSFGDEYTQRNRVDWRARRSFWDLMLEQTSAKSILEVGCNSGWNLLALRELESSLQLIGVDVNREALKEANAAGVDAREMPGDGVGDLWPLRFDLVFTAGVLIHVPPAALYPTMKSIIKASKSFVLSVEYAAEMEEEVDYRGHAQRLWKRPYGEMYEAMGLDVVMSCPLAPGDGFDNCNATLLRKPEA